MTEGSVLLRDRDPYKARNGCLDQWIADRLIVGWASLWWASLDCGVGKLEYD